MTKNKSEFGRIQKYIFEILLYIRLISWLENDRSQMFKLPIWLIWSAVLATLVCCLPADNKPKRFVPYKRQFNGSITTGNSTTTLIFGTTAIVGQESAIFTMNHTTTIFIAHTTFTLTDDATTSSVDTTAPLVAPTGAPIVFPSTFSNNTLLKRYGDGQIAKFVLNEPSATASKYGKLRTIATSTVHRPLQQSPTRKATNHENCNS